MNEDFVKRLYSEAKKTPQEIAELMGYPVQSVTALLKGPFEASEITPASLLATEVSRAHGLSSTYARIEERLLDKIQYLLDSEVDSPSELTLLVRALKELRAIAPAQQLLPKQEDEKNAITIQILNTQELTIGTSNSNTLQLQAS